MKKSKISKKNPSLNNELYKFYNLIIYLFIFLILSVNVQSVISEGLIAYWGFDEESGVISKNNITTNYDNFTGIGSTIETGKINKALGFSGSNQYSSINATIINYVGIANGNFSVNVWIQHHDTAASNYEGIVVTYGNSGDYGWAIQRNNGETNWQGQAYGKNVIGTPLPVNSWDMITITHKVGNFSLYYNGTWITGTTTAEVQVATNKLFLGIFRGGSAYWYDGLIDELSIYNRSLNISDIQSLYNNGLGNSYTNFSSVSSPPIIDIIPSYNVTNNKNPLDINSSFIGIMNITTKISELNNITNPYNKTTSWVELYFNVNTSLNSCAIFYQTSCIKFSNNYYLYNMTKINATIFQSLFTDNDYYPAYYPYNYSFINDNIGANDTIYRQKGIRFNVYNFSTSTQAQFLDIEFQANNLSYFPLNIYYCNSTYANNSPVSNPNCEIIDVFLPSNHIFHFHNISRHYFVPIQIYNVTRTKLSYFLFVSNTILQSNGYDFRYVLNTNYDNSSFNNFNQVFSQSTTNKIYDIHIHNYLEADFIRYYTKYYDGEGYSNTSSVSIDFYNIINVAPSSSFVSVNQTTYTLSNTTNTSILFTWSQSTDLNNDTITYNLTIFNDLYSYNIGVFNQTTTSYNYNISKINIIIGNYYIRMKTCDSFENCDISISDSTFNICSNSWNPDIRPCIGGAQELAYYDSNSCTESFDLPTIYGTYINCSLQIDVDMNESLNNIVVYLDYIGGILIFLIIIIFLIYKQKNNL